ncbi:hypothetical protein T484DRAFT_1918861 [Baffinella frigidus]|nr:hypothetical protein T484DRAFT_1918861 [Cryptophyta sp. CCMP2293]
MALRAIKIVHSPATHDAAFEETTRSSGYRYPSSLLLLQGYPSSLLLLQLRVNVAAATTWSCKLETTVSSRKAAVKSAAPPPLSLECIGAPKEGEAVKTPTLNSVDAWHEMSRRFDVAHDPAARASSDSDFFESARLNVNLEEAERAASSGVLKDDLYDDSDVSRLSDALMLQLYPQASTGKAGYLAHKKVLHPLGPL